MSGLGWAGVVGVGRAVQRDLDEQERQRRQQEQIALEEKRHTRDAVANYFEDVVKNPDKYPAGSDATASQMMFHVLTNPNLKPKDYLKLHQQFIQSTSRERAIDTLGLRRAQNAMNNVTAPGSAINPQSPIPQRPSSVQLPGGSSTIPSTNQPSVGPPQGIDTSFSIPKAQIDPNVMREGLQSAVSSPDVFPTRRLTGALTPQETFEDRTLPQFEAQQQLLQKYDRTPLQIIPQGASAVNNAGEVVFRGEPRMTEGNTNRQLAYQYFASRHPELRLSPIQVSQNGQYEAQARHEYADEINRTQYRSGGSWGINPETLEREFYPTPVIGVHGGQVVPGAGGSAPGSGAGGVGGGPGGGNGDRGNANRSADYYADQVDAGLMTVQDLNALTPYERRLVMQTLSDRQSIPVTKDTKGKIDQFNAAQASLDQLEKALREIDQARGPEQSAAAAWRYSTLLSSLTRNIGRAAGEKGVFTTQDAEQFQHLMGVGSALTIANTLGSKMARDLAYGNLQRTYDLFNSIKQREFGAAYDKLNSQLTSARERLGQSQSVIPSRRSLPDQSNQPSGRRRLTAEEAAAQLLP